MYDCLEKYCEKYLKQISIHCTNQHDSIYSISKK